MAGRSRFGAASMADGSIFANVRLPEPKPIFGDESRLLLVQGG